jgi:hypothetical protein
MQAIIQRAARTILVEKILKAARTYLLGILVFSILMLQKHVWYPALPAS